MLGNLAIVLALPILISSSMSSHYSFIVKEDSWLSLSGSSSVNSFECISNSEIVRGNVIVSLDELNRTLNFSNATLKIDIKSFDCKNPFLNKDFYKALGAEKNPFITIELLDANTKKQTSSGHKGSIMASVSITINEKCKIVEIPIDWQRVDKTRFRFLGFKELNMTDFEITPPSPAFGIIKVHNEIVITFNLLVETNTFASLSEKF